MKTRGVPKAEKPYQNKMQLPDGKQQAASLMDCWRDLIETIVHFEYDCSFEWRGETDGSHDSYQEDLNRYQKKAQNVLMQVLNIKGIDKNKILEEAANECRKREKAGGWGAARCWKIIDNSSRFYTTAPK